ncbi:MAG TPA: hypothetical protein VNN77_19430 [candidate division Zixibacteria bacterium]|nr:hypothetical protein [candidate division Zixibacteria bacterium]
MKKLLTATAIVYASFALTSCSVQDDTAKAPAAPAAPAPAVKAEAKPPAKAKVEKASGDVGLLDTEKNYLILVTKQGKLITLDFDQKTKVTKLTPTPAKISDIGLGSAATVTYTKNGGKNIASSVEYKAKKGGD